MRHAYLAALAATAALVAGAAAAQDAATAPRLSALVASVEDRGLEVREVDRDDGVWEIEAQAEGGARTEIELDAATGAVLSERPAD
jgi:hypothetical protein